jgi:hypothetical protein
MLSDLVCLKGLRVFLGLDKEGDLQGIHVYRVSHRLAQEWESDDLASQGKAEGDSRTYLEIQASKPAALPSKLHRLDFDILSHRDPHPQAVRVRRPDDARGDRRVGSERERWQGSGGRT